MARCTLIVGLMVMALGYYLYLPLPADIKDPWSLRGFTLAMQAMMSISKLTETITGKPYGQTFDDLSYLLNQSVHHRYPELQVEAVSLDGVPARLFRPKKLPETENGSPTIVYIHGGGWVISNIDLYDSWMVRLTLGSQMTVVLVDYRCAPKFPYPAAFDDSLKAVKFVLGGGLKSFGVDASRVGVAGDSAGGNLAAAVSLKLSEKAEQKNDAQETNQRDSAKGEQSLPKLRFQALYNPVTQAVSFNTKSYVQNNGGWFLRKSTMLFYWACYLGLTPDPETLSKMSKDAHISPEVKKSEQASYVIGNQNGVQIKDYDAELSKKIESLVLDPYLCPLMASDVSKVPPAYVIASQYDILREDSLMYADKLSKSGVETELWVANGHAHVDGFQPTGVLDNIATYAKKKLL